MSFVESRFRAVYQKIVTTFTFNTLLEYVNRAGDEGKNPYKTNGNEENQIKNINKNGIKTERNGRVNRFAWSGRAI